MSLAQRTEMRRCGRRYKTRTDAALSKGALSWGKTPVPCAIGCGGWHLEAAQAPVPGNKPTTKVRGLVLVRDQWQCAGCGKPAGGAFTWWSLQHRVARGVGGGNGPENLVVLCGSATSEGCHLKCEQRDPVMHERGLWLDSSEDPLLVPVEYHGEDGGFTRWLTADGGVSGVAPGRAA